MKKIKCKAPEYLKDEQIGPFGIWSVSCENEIKFYQVRGEDGSYLSTYKTIQEAREGAQEYFGGYLLEQEQKKYTDVGMQPPENLLTEDEKNTL